MSTILERRVFHKALEKAKLRRIRFHDRHTFASRLIQNGESLVYVRDQLGHHSIKVTVDVYGHLVPGANKAAVDRLDQTAVLPEDWRERLAATMEPADGRHRTAPPRHQRPVGRARGATSRPVTPREEMVELRGVELDRQFASATEDELLTLPSSGRGRR